MFANLTPVVKNLLLITVAMFVLVGFLPFNVVGVAALYNPISGNFQPWQFVTYMFLHGGLGHLFGNMFALFIFGPLLERFWGSQRFLIFYLVTGVGAGLVYAGVNYLDMRSMKDDMEVYMTRPSPEGFSAYVGDHAAGLYRNLYELMDQYERNPESAQLAEETRQYVQLIYDRNANIPMIGASGAVFGILMAFALLFPNTELFLLFFPFPIKAKYFVGFYLLYELYAEFNRTPGDNIAHLAHLAGALIAFVLIKMWKKERNRFY